MARSIRGVPDRSFSLNPPPLEALDLTGRVLVVVGGTDGLGRALAKQAAARGAQVTVVGRTFRDEGVARLTFVRADLSSMQEATRVGQTLPVENADAVVFTTGIMAAKTRETTAEGLERDLAISYLSRLAVLRGLRDRLGTSRPTGSPAPRVFVMGFPGAGEHGDVDDLNAERGYDAMKVHMNTVAGNEVLVLDAMHACATSASTRASSRRTFAPTTWAKAASDTASRSSCSGSSCSLRSSTPRGWYPGCSPRSSSRAPA
jgi:NAD(P)-dependent dehydrogenase (short-subunit alcohol dehydrogenase family)